MLSLEEEQELANRLYHQNDISAAKQLILPHLRFVVKVARGFSGYGLAMADLIQEGNIGLMKAVRRFNPAVGVRLVSFAVHWIKAEIHEFIIKNWRIVKVATTKAQRKLFFNLRSAKKRLGWFTKAEVDSVAADLGVKPETVLEMEARLNAQDAPYDAPMLDDDEAGSTAPAHFLESDGANPAQLIECHDTDDNRQGQLYNALTALDERSRDILQQRWLNDQKATLHDLADKYQVSAERIRQLEKTALGKLKDAISL